VSDAIKTEHGKGHPVKFIPADQTQKHIHLSSDIKIDSGFSDFCDDDGDCVVVASGNYAERTWFS